MTLQELNKKAFESLKSKYNDRLDVILAFNALQVSVRGGHCCTGEADDTVEDVIIEENILILQLGKE